MKASENTMVSGVKLIVNVGIFAENHVLLVSYRGMPDRQRGWFLPHELVEPFEDPDESVRGVLEEQLGLSGGTAKLSHVESFKGNDRSWHLSLHYKADLDECREVRPSDQVGQHNWFDLDALPDRADVAHHGWALDNIAHHLKS